MASRSWQESGVSLYLALGLFSLFEVKPVACWFVVVLDGWSSPYWVVLWAHPIFTLASRSQILMLYLKNPELQNIKHLGAMC